jgi:hypothetical protein
MARYEVRCEVEVPDVIAAQVQYRQIEDWVRFNLHVRGYLEPSPIQDLELEAVAGSVQVNRKPR